MFRASRSTLGAPQIQQQQSQQQPPSVGSDPLGDNALFAHVSEALKRKAEEEEPVALRNRNVPNFRLRTGTNKLPIQRPPGALAAARHALSADLFNIPLSGPSTTAFHVGVAHPRFAEYARRNRPKMYQWRTREQLLRSSNLKRLVVAPPPKQSEDDNSIPVAASRGRFAKDIPVAPLSSMKKKPQQETKIPMRDLDVAKNEPDIDMGTCHRNTASILHYSLAQIRL